MSLPCGVYSVSYAQDLSLVRTKTHWGLLILWIIFIMVIPFLFGPTLVSWLTLLGITITSALGLHVLTGYCGQISIGHTAFMAVGAFTYANFAKMGLYWPLALIIAGVNGGIVGAVFGFITRSRPGQLPTAAQ